MKNGSNDIELLKKDIHIADKEVKKYMESIKEEYKEVGRKIVDSYYTLELGINKPLPLRNDDETLTKTWRCDGRNQLMYKIFEKLKLDLDAFNAEFIINMLRRWLKCPDIYVNLLEDGSYAIYDDIEDDDCFILRLYYDSEDRRYTMVYLYYCKK